jgi:hypothetical protein
MKIKGPKVDFFLFYFVFYEKLNTPSIKLNVVECRCGLALWRPLQSFVCPWAIVPYDEELEHGGVYG